VYSVTVQCSCCFLSSSDFAKEKQVSNVFYYWSLQYLVISKNQAAIMLQLFLTNIIINKAVHRTELNFIFWEQGISIPCNAVVARVGLEGFN